MLCSHCTGTEHTPQPHHLLTGWNTSEFELRNCAACGKRLWNQCADCVGRGRKLSIIGLCDSCGQSIFFWQSCKTCSGTGKVYQALHRCQPEYARRVTPLEPQKQPGSHPSLRH